MELWALQKIADGIVSLAELEQRHPILGRNLEYFIVTVNRCCRDAYERFSACLDDVLTLQSEPSKTEKAAVLRKLRDASNSHWFRNIARICDDLAAVANVYDADIKKHIEGTRISYIDDHRDELPQTRHSLLILLQILHKHEGDLKEDIQHAVDILKIAISNSRVTDAHERALTMKKEITRNLTRINGVATQITGSVQNGANSVLTKAQKRQIAQVALSRPEIVLLFNMAMILILFITGATVLQFVSIFAFPLLTGFVLTAVTLVNAFYLRSIGLLDGEPFMELVKLALLKFFVPLTSNFQKPRSSSNNDST